jgi:RND family efflux transporter MFP subunit
MNVLRRASALGLLGLAVVGGVLGCGHGAPRPKRGVVERLPRLEVVRPKRQRLKREVELAATVEALKRVDLSARVPGVVAYLPDDMDIGRKVTAGQVLLKLAVPELEADRQHREAVLAQAQKQKAQAAEALTVARREVEEAKKENRRYQAEHDYHRLRTGRIRDLWRRNAQDVQVLQEAEKQLEAAAAALESNQARVLTRQAKAQGAEADLEVAARRIDVAAAEVRKVQELVGFATVQAPFDGVITKRWVDPGAIIKDPGALLLTVMQVDRVRVLVDVPQRDVPLLNSREQNPNPNGQGDPVTVRIPALAERVDLGEFKGTITRVSRALDPVTRTMRAEVELDNRTGYLQPGMYGTALVLIEDRPSVLTVPASALVRRGEGMVEVYHVVPEASYPPEGEERRGVLRRVPVTLGIDDGREAEVRSGLKGDELIVARGNGVMRAEDKVVAVPEREPAAEKKE